MKCQQEQVQAAKLDQLLLLCRTHRYFIYLFVLNRHFVEACGHGLGINERLIKEDQQEYHDEMKANYRDLARELSIIMHEQVSIHVYFSVQSTSVIIF